MARLPTPGSDDGTWGDILNTFLKTEHNPDGSQKPLPQSTIIDLEDDLDSKATDATVVHLAGAETILGAKTFNANTFLDKGSQVYNVKAYGAVGDGVANDHVAIQAALTAAGAAEGGVVFVPAGTYLVGVAVNIPSNVTLTGTGMMSVLKAAASMTANNIVVLQGVTDVTLSNLKLEHNGTGSQVGAITYTGAGNTIAVRHTVSGCHITNTSNNAFRVASPVKDFKFAGNYIYSCVSGISCQPTVTGSRGIDISHNHIRDITGTGAVCIQVYGPAASRYADVRISNNYLEPGGSTSIPIEPTGIDGCVVSGNVIEASTRGVSSGTCTELIIANNIMRDQTLYAVETQNSHCVTIANNIAYSCASLVHETGSIASTDLSITGNLHVGTGLSAPITGNHAVKIFQGTGVYIANNAFRGLEHIEQAIRLGVGLAVNNATVKDNHLLVDTANSGPMFINMSFGTDQLVEDNKVKITRDLVVADDNKRVISVTQGGNVTGAVVRNNEVVFAGTIAAATSLVAIGTAFAGAGTLPRSAFIGNRAINGPIGFRCDSTSADMLFQDNEGRSCTTEVSAINTAVILRRTKREYEATATPTAGTWQVGDRVWNSTPAAAGIPGWVCTTAGTPGTWKAMANLAA